MPVGLRCAGAIAHEARRKQTRQASLSNTAIQWLAELPANLRPTGTALRFPHIANHLAELWLTPERCGEYLDGLMRNERIGRRGFPAEIAFELVMLKKHHDSIARRSKNNAWTKVILR